VRLSLDNKRLLTDFLIMALYEYVYLFISKHGPEVVCAAENEPGSGVAGCDGVIKRHLTD